MQKLTIACYPTLPLWLLVGALVLLSKLDDVQQVMDAFTEPDVKSTAPACKHTGGMQLMSGGRELVPALGLAWANCINSRIFLSKTDYAVSTSCLQQSAQGSLPQPATLPLRCMQVVFSPCLPQDSCFFVVTQHGLEGVDPSQLGQADIQWYHQETDSAEVDQSGNCSNLQSIADGKEQIPPDSVAKALQPCGILQGNTHAAAASSSALPCSETRQTCTVATGVFASF